MLSPPRHGLDTLLGLLDFLPQIQHLLAAVIAIREEGALAERRDPVLVPEQLEQVRVQRTFEVGNLERIIPAGVCAKVFDFREWD